MLTEEQERRKTTLAAISISGMIDFLMPSVIEKWGNLARVVVYGILGKTDVVTNPDGREFSTFSSGLESLRRHWA